MGVFMHDNRKKIGTCKDCKHWKHTNWNYGECSPMLDGMGIHYLAEERKDLYCFGFIGFSGKTVSCLSGSDFGCIHWEEKEEVNK